MGLGYPAGPVPGMGGNHKIGISLCFLKEVIVNVSILEMKQMVQVLNCTRFFFLTFSIKPRGGGAMVLCLSLSFHSFHFHLFPPELCRSLAPLASSLIFGFLEPYFLGRSKAFPCVPFPFPFLQKGQGFAFSPTNFFRLISSSRALP